MLRFTGMPPRSSAIWTLLVLWRSPDWGPYLRILLLGLLTLLAMLIVLTTYLGQIVRVLRGWPT
ncbi:MAG: hypothetical protein IT307_03160 [Chloroflexi bacterium]|nr:hypothetical protein [Chloroflexota bacterium]